MSRLLNAQYKFKIQKLIEREKHLLIIPKYSFLADKQSLKKSIL